MSQRQRAAGDPSKANRVGNAPAKKADANLVITSPEMQCYEDDYLVATGTASSGANRAVVVWGKIYSENNTPASNPPTPWFDGQLPHAQCVPTTTAWALGPFATHVGEVNTIIVWATFPGEGTLTVQRVPFEVHEDCEEWSARARKKVAKTAPPRKKAKKK